LVVFTASDWNQPHTVTVTGVNDDFDDGDIAYNVITGAAGGGDPVYDGMASADVSLVNADDDTAGVIVSPLSATTTEAGGTAVINIRLTAQPIGATSVRVSSSDTTEGTVPATIFGFTAANWQAGINFT